MRRNFDLSAVLVAIGAVTIVIALFLDWYAPGLSAWDVFEIVDWALLALALAALGLAGADALGRREPGERLVWIAAALGLLVLAQLVDAPPAAAGAEREIGAWLALAGAVLVAAGVMLALLRISVTIDVSDRDRRRRTSAVDARAGARARDDRAGEPSAGDEDRTRALWNRPAGKRAAAKGRPVVEAHPDAQVEASAKPPVEPEREPGRGSVEGGRGPADDAPGDDPERTQSMEAIDPRTERRDE